jgi:hypothetical protein
MRVQIVPVDKASSPNRLIFEWLFTYNPANIVSTCETRLGRFDPFRDFVDLGWLSI